MGDDGAGGERVSGSGGGALGVPRLSTALAILGVAYLLGYLWWQSRRESEGTLSEETLSDLHRRWALAAAEDERNLNEAHPFAVESVRVVRGSRFLRRHRCSIGS